MFHRDEYVFHESGGICKIADIQISPIDGMPSDRLYYVLKPIQEPNSVIYIPVDSDRIFLRRLLSQEEAKSLLDHIPSVEAIEETNSKFLRAKYNEAMKTHDPLEWVRVIKTVYQRSMATGSRGSRLSESERGFSELAKRYLHTELALALDLQPQDMEAYITAHVEKMA